ncbi:MAG TPA: hypothetical protein PKB09_02635 [Candidatus Saccharibacteria bacterium]|nr:hypothetical protein [Candidatus Saccharibacteria bacterium]
MDPIIRVDERVEVAATYHLRDGLPACMPLKMKYKKQEVVFKKLGLRHPTKKGLRMIHVFDVSDGVNDYRLEFDAEALIWKLTAILEGENAVTN